MGHESPVDLLSSGGEGSEPYLGQEGETMCLGSNRWGMGGAGLNILIARTIDKHSSRVENWSCGQEVSLT